MKHLETSIPGILLIMLGALLIWKGDGKEQTLGIGGGIVAAGLTFLRTADASKVVEKPSEEMPKPQPRPSIPPSK